MVRVVFVALAVLAGASAGWAQSRSGIEIDTAWARATPGSSKDSAAYLRIRNTGTTPDRLLTISTPLAGTAELHETKVENGVMKMRPVEALAVAPGETVELKPGGEHIMLTGLKQPLKPGDSFPLTLKFESAGDVAVTVKVERAGAMSMTPPAGQMDHGAMDHGRMAH
ncbi:MAG TPA: copper chaperone PCu(A)C [Alphaproteobacteria bacterium]